MFRHSLLFSRTKVGKWRNNNKTLVTGYDAKIVCIHAITTELVVLSSKAYKDSELWLG